jgi:hypothetical protein
VKAKKCLTWVPEERQRDEMCSSNCRSCPLADFDAEKSEQVSRIANGLKEYSTRVIKEANAENVECEKV